MADKQTDLLVHDFGRGFLLKSQLRQDVTPVVQNGRIVGGNDANGTSNASARPAIAGLIYDRSGAMRPETLYVDPDLDFNDLATPWEKRWSSLCKGRGTFTPVLAETAGLRKFRMGTVAAHRGNVRSDSLVQYGSPRFDKGTRWLGGKGTVWVMDKDDPTVPDGWCEYGVPQTNYDVLTTTDGQVLAVFGAVDQEGLQDANWVIGQVIAPLLAPMMVRLAYAGAGFCTSLVFSAEASGEDNLGAEVGSKR